MRLSRKNSVLFLIAGLGILCWFKLFFLKGFWWDDWIWLWHYYGSKGLSEFLLPWKDLRHAFDGYISFSYFKLLDILPLIAANIWGALKIMFYILNSLLLYFIAKRVLSRESLLPIAISVTYLTSPIVLNLCLLELTRRIYLSLFLLSILCSVKSADRAKFNLPYYLSALFLAYLSMFCLESFVFFDIARPVIIFYIYSKHAEFNFIKAFKRTVLYWLPFILGGVVILIFRTGLIVTRVGVNAHIYDVEKMSVFKYPGFLLLGYIKSLFFMLASYAWSFVGRNTVVTAEPFMIFQAIITAILAVAIIFRKNILSEKHHRDTNNFFEARMTAIFGIILILGALFPYIMINGSYSMGLASRHGLTASIGFSVFLSAIFLMLYYKDLIRKSFLYFLFGFTIFLGVFQCNMAVKSYSEDWKQQGSFWREFIHRVPDLEDKTYLLIDMPRKEKHYFGEWRGIYEFSAPLNLLYAKSRDKNMVNRFYAGCTSIASDDSYLSNADKKEEATGAFIGPQTYYPKNLIIASYRNGSLLLNDEICRPGRNCTDDIRILLPHAAPGQILHKSFVSKFPFRWIISPEWGNADKTESLH